VVQITPVPTVARMVGVGRILRGKSVTSPCGDPTLPVEAENMLIHKYVKRALELLASPADSEIIYTIEGRE